MELGMSDSKLCANWATDSYLFYLETWGYLTTIMLIIHLRIKRTLPSKLLYVSPFIL